ncbi:DUF6114 domain-containing protein [Geobacillus proteiniphilus]|uniref:DUF6114 domain-containing protein n=1 Tax=Geobacillus proteiniphilus TaxID=860353 RepID=A0ABY9MGV3_9BACL|nr:DUF6114 domain-containing protein [Geobacillus proteiniphilus]WMJ16874.1 DUF6114 domain-containing protein [Geobacillus proteiniphilus]
MRKMDEIVQMVIVGALTGAFIGGIVIGGGMDGALWGGLALAVGLALIVWPLQDRPSVLSRVKYGAAAFLPGMLVGGSQWVSLGAIGAVAGGMASSVLFAILFHNMIVRHEEQGRYVRTLFHYLWLFFGGSTVTFLALNAIGVAERSFPWQSWVRSAPLAVLMAIIIALALGGCVVCASWHKRRTETWRQAWAAARRGGAVLLLAAGVSVVVVSLLHFGFLSVHTAVRWIGPLGSYALGWGVPCSFGYLLAANRYRPVLGSALAIAGAVFVLIVGISVFPMLLLPGSGLMWAGLVTGLVMMVLAVLSIIKPDSHVVLGSFLILTSILSFIGAAGGLIIGGVIGLLGGALVAGWNGQKEQSADSDYPSSTPPLPPHSPTMTG